MGELDGHRSHNQQDRHSQLFAVGSEVEVSFDEEGFRGACFRAAILKIPTKSPPSKKKKAFIEYKSLVTEDGSGRLREHVDIVSLRPVPPDNADKDFEEGDVVDADDKDGWWTGVVEKVLGNARYSVYFPNPPHVIDFERDKLRLHQDWVEGEWVRHKKMSTKEHVDRGGEQVKQGTRPVLGNRGNTSGLSLRTRVRDKRKNSFGVLEMTSKKEVTGKESEMDDHSASEHKWMAGSSQLLTKVVQRLKLTGGADKHLIDKANMNGKESELQQAKRNSQKRKRGRPRKLILAPRAMGDIKQDGDEDNMDKVVIRGCINDFEVVQRNGNELTKCKTDGVEDDRPLLMWFGEKHSSASINESGQTPNKAAKLLSEAVNIVNKEGVDDGPGDNVLVKNQGSPFVKNSPIWKAIDSLEVFHLIPQVPHFHPLGTYKEECREGLAIGTMVTFASLVEKISKLKFEDPRHVFESILESLFDLEQHGFDISMLCNRVNELLSIKARQVQCYDETKEAEDEMMEHVKEKTKLEEEMNAIEQNIAELEKKHASIKLETEAKENEITRLQSLIKGISERTEHTRLDFEKLVTLPLKPELP